MEAKYANVSYSVLSKSAQRISMVILEPFPRVFALAVERLFGGSFEFAREAFTLRNYSMVCARREAFFFVALRFPP
jgi:hypothetical protein